MSKTRETLLTEFYVLWDSAVSNLPVEMQVEHYGWIPDYGKFLEEVEQEERQLAGQHLYPFLFIYEVALESLIVFHQALNDLIAKGFEWALVPSILMANAHIYGVAIHRLILSGFDTPSRALLRNLLEVIDICLLTIDDSALAQGWVSCEDPADSNAFWYKNLRSKNLSKKVNDIISRGGQEELVKEVIAWRSSVYKDHSQAVHLTNHAAYCTLYPSSFSERDTAHSGIFGKVTPSSIRTLREGAGFIFLFTLVAINLMAKKPENPLKEASKDVKAALLVSKEVLKNMIIQNWERP